MRIAYRGLSVSILLVKTYFLIMLLLPLLVGLLLQFYAYFNVSVCFIDPGTKLYIGQHSL